MDHHRQRRRFVTGARPQLALGGLAVAATISLGGCGSPDVQPAEFTSVAECTAAGFAQELCDAGQNAASLEHQRAAPKFTSLDACRQEWGSDSCVPASGLSNGSSGGNVFVPLLAGFVLSQAMQQRYYDTGRIDRYGGGYGGSPIYRSRTGGTVTLDRSGGTPKMTPVNVNTRTVSASGFGGMGMSRSSSGG